RRRVPDDAALSRHRGTPRGRRGADPRRDRRTRHRRIPGARARDRPVARRGPVPLDVRARPRDGTPRRRHQRRREGGRAQAPLLAPVGEGRRVMRRALTAVGFALGLPVCLVVVWWFATRTSANPFVPQPVPLVTTFLDTWFGDRFASDVVPSISRFAIGAVVAVVLGVVIGLLIGLSRTLRAFTEPTFEFFRAVPPPVLIPILGLLIGVGDDMKVAV